MMKRTAAHAWTCTLLLWVLTETDGKTQDVQVTCQYSEDCILPCSFTPSGGEEIRWFKQDVLIYSHSQSFSFNDRIFEDRTAIAAQELTLGNASLVLQRCVLSDRGRYRCQVTKSEKTDEVFIGLKVEAPVRSVNLEISRLSGYEEVKCSTCGVYPAPHVSWSTNPPTPMEDLIYTTRKTSDKHGLYSMESRLKRLGHRTDMTYICTVNSSSSGQTWTTSLTETAQNNITVVSKLFIFATWTEINTAEGQDITIPCRSPWNLQNFTLSWFVTRANTLTLICTYNSETQLIENHWKGTAWLDPQLLQEGDGSLRLNSIQSLEHIGVYTCNVSTVQRSHVGQTRVNITSLHFEDKHPRTESSSPWWMPVTVIVALILIIAAFIIGILKLQHRCTHNKPTRTASYSKEVKVTINKSEEITEENCLTSDHNKEHT